MTNQGVGTAYVVAAAWMLAILLPASLDGQEVVDLRTLHLPQWTLEEEFRLGSMDGEHDAFVRPSLVVGPDGHLLVVDPGVPAVRLFDPEGGYLRQFGRRGQGPGEYTSPASAGFLGDTIWVADVVTRRLAFFGWDGSVLADFALESSDPGVAPPLPVEVLGSDDFLVVDPPGPDRSFAGHGVGPVLFDQAILRRGRSVVHADTVLTHRVEAGFIITRADRDGFGVIPYGPIRQLPISTHSATHGEIVMVERPAASRGDVGEFRVTIRGTDGQRLADRRFRYRPVPIPAAVRDSIRADMRSRFSATQQAHLAVALEHLAIPDFLPPVSGAPRRRGDGSRWIPREALPGAAPAEYLIVDAALNPLATIQAPVAGRHLTGGRSPAIGDRVWVAETDEWDVPYLVRYRIRR